MPDTTPTELHVILRHGLALLTVRDGRTAVARFTPSTESFHFDIVTWCDTYAEALVIAQLSGDDEQDVAGSLTA